MASPGQAPDFQSITALIKTLTNVQLKDILRNEGLTVSGVKVSLQLRIIDCQFINPTHHSPRPCLENPSTLFLLRLDSFAPGLHLPLANVLDRY